MSAGGAVVLFLVLTFVGGYAAWIVAVIAAWLLTDPVLRRRAVRAA